ncbi:MAG: TolC family outer membrane protein [Methylococcales bacterium]
MRRLILALISLTFSLSSTADNLLSLYQRALLASPELKGSQFALDITRAQEDQSFGKLLPQAVLTGNYSGNSLKYETKSGNQYPGSRAGLNVRQPLFDLQSYLLMKSQTLRTAQGEENLVSAHQQLIFDLVDRYVDALEMADKIQIISAELGSTEKQLTRVKSMSDRQMALVTDLYQLQARVETLRTSLIDSKNDANIALEKLRELTGDAVTFINPVRLDATQPPPEGSVETWVEQVGRNNPDIKSLKHAVESANQSISAYQAGHLPRVELQAGANYSDTSFNNQQSPPYNIGMVGVEATMPIYEGGITTARISEAEGRKGLSSSQLEQKLRELEKITRASYLDMATSPARSLATDRQLEANEKAKLAMEKGYELGVVTIVDLLNAEKQLSDSLKIQRQARYRYFKARNNLLRQAGRLDVEELAKLNSWLAADSTQEIIAEPVININNAKKMTTPVPNLVTKSNKVEPPVNFSEPSKPAVIKPSIDTTDHIPTVNLEPKPSDKPNSQVITDDVDNTVTDSKIAERAAVNAKVQTFVHSDFKPVIKSVEPYKPTNKPTTNSNFKPVIKSVTQP